ncbi:putative AT DNA binding protein [Diaporthe sp. PMI_573]|nr:putative AT DNA binding protein [Diaporthaceae sp. PMI_573]
MELPSMDSVPMVPPQLVSLLSACSYSIPDGPSHPEDPTISHPTPNTETTPQTEMATVNLDAAESSTPPRAPRKRGRPRKTPDNGAALTPKERRRVQILNAQRAYQSRKEGTISNQKDRISKLEATVLRMNSLVGLLGDQLADSLALQPHLASSLRSTVAACASLAKEVDQSKVAGDLPSPQHERPSSLPGDRGILPSPTSPMRGTPPVPSHSRSLRSLMPLLSPPSSDTAPCPVSTTTSHVELSTFISQLRLACAYNAFETLSDPTVGLDSIRNKFCFLLSLMSREHLTSYYKASLQARIDRSALKPWETVPFFGLGGAGSHYARPSPEPPRGSSGTQDSPQHEWPQVSDPLFTFSTQIRESLDDTWFDARDLEGYLKEKGVCLAVCPPSTPQDEDLPTCIDVVRLLQVLVSGCICLGRSPGWRRCDVEEAVRKAASPQGGRR